MSTGLHVVVGAGGASGRRVVHHLHLAGHRVRAVTRDGRDVGTPGVELVAADAADPASLAAACSGASVVYHCVMPPLERWLPDFPVLTDALVEAAASAGARLVFADDTWMYGRVDAPMTEDTPWRPVSHLGTLRAWLAERLLHAGASGRLPVSIVRAGELYGPGVRSLIAKNVFGAALAGRPVHWFGDPDLPITPTFIDDFGRTLAVVGTQDEAQAAVWHVPHPGVTTGRRLAAEACRQSGTRLRLLRHGSGQLRAVGHLWPLARAGAALVYQFEQPFVVDGSRAAERFRLAGTPYQEGVAVTLEDADGGRSWARPARTGGPVSVGRLLARVDAD
jgi:nucleoside-diphosphate-sugar epimerase